MHYSYLGALVPWMDCIYPVPRLFLPSQQTLHECFKIWDGRNLSGHTAQLQWVTTINDPFCSPPDWLPPVEDEVCVYVSCSYGMSIDSINALFWVVPLVMCLLSPFELQETPTKVFGWGAADNEGPPVILHWPM
jgi:hypothetical protein